MSFAGYRKFMDMPIPELPENILSNLRNNPNISKIEFSEANQIINQENLQNEIGFVELNNKEYLVAMRSELPNTNSKMIDWWFWWQAQESERYQLWFPGEHKSTSYKKSQRAYFSNEYKAFTENTQYPVERVGKITAELSIRFVDPARFGIKDKDKVINNNGTIICGYVGILKGIIQHTKMLHYFKPNEKGMILISRFWLGNGLPRLIKGIAANKNQAFEMAKHCWIEYTRLGQILPEVYKNIKT